LKKYLLDTDICIYYIKGQFGLNEKFVQADPDNCYISEITLAELMFGVENSDKKEKNQKALDDFLSGIKLIPIFHSLDFYAKEKARLKRTGKIIDDFDLLIGATAVTQGMILVTNNTDHFDRITGIMLENWIL
jgi:tRNA(fMet)-specific endonuclease VapC